MSSRVTMSDVARQAGVSLMTVSRVINQKGDVNPETRQRVLTIIKDLNFRPSAIARSLATQETRTIGLVIPDVSNPFFADITRGIEQLAYAQGYHVFLCNTEENPQRELALIQSLEEKQIDGLILCSSRLDDEQLLQLLDLLPAVVLINRYVKADANNTFQSVLLDEERGGMLATCHLIERGHSRIGYVAGPAASFSGQGRRTGYLAAMKNAGHAAKSGWTMHCPPSVEGGRKAVLRLLESHPELTALFCYNDLVAIGALQAAAELNLHVPAQLAIVGHDDIPIASLISPTLTTCRVQRRELGVLAVEALIERMRDCPSGCEKIVLSPELIIRQSAP